MGGLQGLGRRAIELAEAGRHADAVLLWEEMHRQQPTHAGITMALAAALLAAARIDDAERWLALCGQRHPTDKGIALLMGRTLMQQKKYTLAVGAFYHALSLDPACSEIHAHLASALFWARESAAALPHAEIACRAELNELSVSTYLCILLDLGYREQLLAFIERAIEAGALNRATLLMYRAGALQAAGRLDEGLDDLREVIGLVPENGVARHHYAVALLARGELTAEAWAHYEGRTAFLAMQEWPAASLRWTDQDVRGRTVLVHAEQGLGDTLQFIRYVPLLAALGARVVVAVQPSLVRLLQGTPGAAEVIAAGSLPAFDVYCPMMSLPGHFGTTLETIPPPLPYAIPLPPPSRAACLRVGLVWAGKATFVEDRKRSLDPALLPPLGDIAGVEFHNLQFDATCMPLPGMRNAMSAMTDFVDTAALIATLDIVVAVDTSVAHLAATMGKPVWLLNRYNGCWRWLLEREDSPWYPSVRQFRQPAADDWASVVTRVGEALKLAAAEHRDVMALAA